VIKDGHRRLLFNLDQVDPADGDFFYPSDVRILPDNQVISLPLEAPMYEDGQLLAGPPPGPVYIIEDGMRHRIPDPDTFNRHGYSWSAVTILPQVILDKIPEDEALPDLVKSGVFNVSPAGLPGSIVAPAPRNAHQQSLFSWDSNDWRMSQLLKDTAEH
jgi:hypothetical protein